MRACDHRTLSATCSLATYGGMCSIFCGTTDGCTTWRARHTMLHLPAFGGTPVRHTASPMTQLHATVGSIHGRASPCVPAQPSTTAAAEPAPLQSAAEREKICTVLFYREPLYDRADSLFSVRATGAVFVDRINADGGVKWMKDDDT